MGLLARYFQGGLGRALTHRAQLDEGVLAGPDLLG